MEDPFHSQNDENYPVLRAYSAPNVRRRPKRPSMGSRARDAGSPYTSRSSPSAASPAEQVQKRRRCVSAGSALTRTDLPLAVGSAAKSISAPEVIEISDDEPAERDIQPSGPQSSSRQRSRPQSESRSPPAAAAAEAALGEPAQQTAQPERSAASGSPKAGRRAKKSSHKVLTPTQLDSKIEGTMKAQLKGKESERGEFGSIYILVVTPKSARDKRILKIGSTKHNGATRAKAIDQACKHASIDQHDDLLDVPIRLFLKAERLIHAELTNSLYVFDCDCEKHHREYFDVDKAVAQEVVQRWREFCRQDPYGGSDEKYGLLPFWEDRLRERRRCEASETISDHAERQRRWGRFASPASLDVLIYDASYTLPRIWRWKWQAVAFLQSFLIAWLAYPASWSLVACLIVCLGALFEMNKFEQLATLALIQRVAKSLQKHLIY